MFKIKHITLVIGILLLISNLLLAQKKGKAKVPSTGTDKYGQLYPMDEKTLPRRSQPQQADFTKLTYAFPGAPRSKWSVGLLGGVNFFHGDVLNKTKLQIGAQVSKSIGHAFSLRAVYIYGKLGGQNKEANSIYQGSIDEIYGYSGTTIWNFETSYQYLALHMMLTLNNINFYNDDPKLKLYGFFGPALMYYSVRTNLRDENDKNYDYSNGINGVNLDNTFETLMDKDTSKNSLVQPTPILSTGFGVSFKLTKRIEAGIEYSYHNEMLLKNDLWDGRRFQEKVDVLSTDYDGFSTVRLFVNYSFGKGADPLTWINPLEVEYEEVMELKKKIKDLIADSDDDGVADPFDKELDTPKGAKVSPDGVTLDSDNDGNPDYLDPEPYSPYKRVVDSSGITPTNVQGIPVYLDEYFSNKLKECCEKKYIYPGGNGYKEIIQNTDPKDKLWGVIPKPVPSQPAFSTGLWALPTIHFDLDKDEIKPEMFDDLLYVATAMRNNPQMRVVINGHCDVRLDDAYNIGLGKRRALKTKEHLIKYFNVNPERLEINTYGKRQNLVPNANTEIEHYMNRRVEFYPVLPQQ